MRKALKSASKTTFYFSWSDDWLDCERCPEWWAATTFLPSYTCKVRKKIQCVQDSNCRDLDLRSIFFFMKFYWFMLAARFVGIDSHKQWIVAAKRVVMRQTYGFEKINDWSWFSLPASPLLSCFLSAVTNERESTHAGNLTLRLVTEPFVVVYCIRVWEQYQLSSSYLWYQLSVCEICHALDFVVGVYQLEKKKFIWASGFKGDYDRSEQLWLTCYLKTIDQF